jgi:hypothetical protein
MIVRTSRGIAVLLLGLLVTLGLSLSISMAAGAAAHMAKMSKCVHLSANAPMTGCAGDSGSLVKSCKTACNAPVADLTTSTVFQPIQHPPLILAQFDRLTGFILPPDPHPPKIVSAS